MAEPLTPAQAQDALDEVEAGLPADHRARAHLDPLRSTLTALSSRGTLEAVVTRVTDALLAMTAQVSAAVAELAQWRPHVLPLLEMEAGRRQRSTALTGLLGRLDITRVVLAIIALAQGLWIYTHGDTVQAASTVIEAGE